MSTHSGKKKKEKKTCFTNEMKCYRIELVLVYLSFCLQIRFNSLHMLANTKHDTIFLVFKLTSSSSLKKLLLSIEKVEGKNSGATARPYFSLTN